MRTFSYGEASEPEGDGGARSETASLRCGDCHSPIDPPVKPSPSQAAFPSSGSAEEFYCPLCSAPVAAPLRCADCGSTICPACGTPVELADELGIG